MATGEESDDESLGGAEMHARISGLADYFAVDELDAIRLGRRIVARLNWVERGPAPGPVTEPLFDAEELIGIVPPDLRIPFDPREVIARIVDGSEFDEFKPMYGSSLVTGWARLHGYPLGILANARGVLFSEESQKATQFIQLANRSDTPLLFLHNTTGYMVGKDYEEGGMIKHGSMMINAVSNSTVPHISLLIGASYGAGHYGMCGRAYDPRFLFAWPSAKAAWRWVAPSCRACCRSWLAPPPKPADSTSTRRQTPRCGRPSRARSKPSRFRWSCRECSMTTG